MDVHKVEQDVGRVTHPQGKLTKYDSEAYRLLIPEFRLLNVTSPNSSAEISELDYEFVESREGYYPNFPVIIQSDGSPWEIGNLYLVVLLQKAPIYESRSFRSKADHLLDYLRFLEDEVLDYLYFPANDMLKVTYRYRRRLMAQIDAGEIGRGTASARINAVVNFYKSIIRYDLVDRSLFKHEPFEAVRKYIWIESNFGLGKIMPVESHDLAIMVPKAQKLPEFVSDGGPLRPLSIEEQEHILEALLQSSREYQLMFYLSLFTGARIQTVCTIQVRHVWQKLDGDGNLRLPIGKGTGVDTKGGRNMTLIIPGWLVESLRVYSRSAASSKRREISFYGNVDNNYLFLTNNGSEHYTSKAEIKHRENRVVSSRASDRDKIYGSIREGATVRQFISETLIPRIRILEPDFLDFRFHDLRASFGMNLLEHEIEIRGQNGVMAAVEYVQQRMGHSDKKVTLQYLNYKTNLQRKSEIQSKYEARLFKYVSMAGGLGCLDD